MDLFRYLADGVEPLYAAARAPAGIDTTVAAVTRLPGGGLGNFLYSCEAKEKDIFVVIETLEGMLELRGWDLDLARNTIDESRPEPESKPIFEKETHAFLQAVATGNKNLILVDFEEACQTQIVMDTVVRMIRSSVTNL
jgi:predicted dehydrogenase